MLNLGWAALAAVSFVVSLLPANPEGLSGELLLLALLAFSAGGLGMFIWILAFAAVGVLGGQPEPQWTPLFFGALVGAYNVCGIRPLTLTIALSQLLFILAPVPNLAIHFSWEAIPCGIGGAIVACLSAMLISTLIQSYEKAGVLEPHHRLPV